MDWKNWKKLNILVFYTLSLIPYSFGAPSKLQFKMDFVQTYQSKISKKEKQSHGELIYSYPKKIKIEMTSPDKIIFVSNGVKSWYYRSPFIEGEAGEVIISRGNEQLNTLTVMFDALNDLFTQGSGGLNQDALKKSKLFQGEWNDNGTVLTLTFSKEFSDKIKLKGALLRFQKNNPGLMDLTLLALQTDEKNLQGEFRVKKIESFSANDSQFEFVIPKNTKITE